MHFVIAGHHIVLSAPPPPTAPTEYSMNSLAPVMTENALGPGADLCNVLKELRQEEKPG